MFTIGHSNQPLIPFIAALGTYGIRAVADVRRTPFSRRHPHFSQPNLAPALEDLTIRYLHVPELGGHREPRPDSPHTAIRDRVLRGYADHMDTPEFASGLARLLEEAAARPLAMMCAERAWADCHRQLIADRLTADGHEVIHILSEDACEQHPYSRYARLVDGQLSYRGLL